MYLVNPNLVDEGEVWCQFNGQKMEIFTINKPVPDLRAGVSISSYRLKDDVITSILGTHEIKRTSFGYNLRKAGKVQYQLVYRTGDEPLKISKKENLL